jgi:hypothetical protein
MKNYFAKKAVQDVIAEVGDEVIRTSVERRGAITIVIHSAVKPVITGVVRTPKQRRSFVEMAVSHTHRYHASV